MDDNVFPLTNLVLNFVKNPSSSFGYYSNKYVATTRLSTESPRNSSRS